ncbi:MAG: phosphoribosylformylglycinamidine synthase subunit PurS [Candidatus Omnitrophota bacterium]
MLKAEVYITLKKTIADPQGLIIKHALESLGYGSVKEARVGKMVIVTLDTDDKKQAQKQLDQMCKKLLANPVIEDYRFVITEAK